MRCVAVPCVSTIKQSLAVKTRAVLHFFPMVKKTGVNTSELGNAVRRRREERGLSLRDVADKTGVSASTLSRIENGTGKPDADNIARLASWLDMLIERVMHHGHRTASEQN